jgi:hypothetical protein
LPKLWKGIKSVFNAITNFFSGKNTVADDGEKLVDFGGSDEKRVINKSSLKMEYKKKG